MQTPTPGTVAGAFDGRSIAASGATYTMSQTPDVVPRYTVSETRPDGSSFVYRVVHTFGARPLQQYLVEGIRGRLQVLPIAWDVRPAAVGGQRWFAMHPDEALNPGDDLHWLGPNYTWNFMCLDCHSSKTVKGFEPLSDRYETTFAAQSVSCTACHGDASLHAAQARTGARPTRTPLDPRARTSRRTWTFEAGKAIATLRPDPNDEVRLDVCAPCHSHRVDLGPAPDAGSFADRYALTVPQQPLYFPDGQPKEEVYVLGSFAQSKMHDAGVLCQDCHDPHTAGLKIAGNALCSQCHAPAAFDTVGHHGHAGDPGSPGTDCVDCHMPARTYMHVDERRDHSFSVPRPGLSGELGSPDACAGCHRDRSTAWAVADIATRRAVGATPTPDARERLARARHDPAHARPRLESVLDDASAPAIVRAAALLELADASGLGPGPLELRVVAARDDADPIVRRVAAELASRLRPSAQLEVLSVLARDPVRSVRLAAHASGRDFVDTFDQGRLAAEARASLEYGADRPGGLINLANFEAERGRPDEAESWLARANERFPTYAPAYINRSDLARARGDEDLAERILRGALVVARPTAGIHHALGLSLIRQGRPAAALDELALACDQAPADVSYGYVYAVALRDGGQPSAALVRLRELQGLAPNDARITAALVAFESEDAAIPGSSGPRSSERGSPAQ